MSRPLFIPLKAEYYQAFLYATKSTEYRLFGPRWNLKVCAVGRRVRLSYGYGKSRPRLHGEIVRVRRIRNTLTSIYPKGAWLCAMTIRLDG